MGERAVDERFLERFVTVLVLDVLADDADRDLVVRVVGAMDDVFQRERSGVGASMWRYLRMRVSTPSSEKLSGTP